MATAENKTWYSANCHCGAVRYRALLPPLPSTEVMSCNCAMCTRNGYLNLYPLRHEIKVRLDPGNAEEEASPGTDAVRNSTLGLGYYPLEAKGTEHVFCLKCGSSLWVDANGGEKGALDGEPDIVAINVSDGLATLMKRCALALITGMKGAHAEGCQYGGVATQIF
jgi:hypothetical protein